MTPNPVKCLRCGAPLPDHAKDCFIARLKERHGHGFYTTRQAAK